MEYFISFDGDGRESLGTNLAKATDEVNTKTNAEEEAKHGKNGMTFRLVKRRKAGPVEKV